VFALVLVGLLVVFLYCMSINLLTYLAMLFEYDLSGTSERDQEVVPARCRSDEQVTSSSIATCPNRLPRLLTAS